MKKKIEKRRKKGDYIDKGILTVAKCTYSIHAFWN